MTLVLVLAMAAGAPAARAGRPQEVKPALHATTVVQSQPLTCTGRTSGATDPTRDVVWASGMDPVDDQSRPTIDVQAVSLHSRAGKLCWQVRFAHPPGASFELNVRVSRNSRRPVAWNVQPVVFTHEVSISVKDGKALAGLDPLNEETTEFVPIELSQTGNLIRVKLASRDVLTRREGFSTRRSFRWTLQSLERNPTGFEDTLYWMDEVPGSLHSPWGRRWRSNLVGHWHLGNATRKNELPDAGLPGLCKRCARPLRAAVHRSAPLNRRVAGSQSIGAAGSASAKYPVIIECRRGLIPAQTPKSDAPADAGFSSL